MDETLDTSWLDDWANEDDAYFDADGNAISAEEFEAQSSEPSYTEEETSEPTDSVDANSDADTDEVESTSSAPLTMETFEQPTFDTLDMDLSSLGFLADMASDDNDDWDDDWGTGDEPAYTDPEGNPIDPDDGDFYDPSDDADIGGGVDMTEDEKAAYDAAQMAGNDAASTAAAYESSKSGVETAKAEADAANKAASDANDKFNEENQKAEDLINALNDGKGTGSKESEAAHQAMAEAKTAMDRAEGDLNLAQQTLDYWQNKTEDEQKAAGIDIIDLAQKAEDAKTAYEEAKGAHDLAQRNAANIDYKALQEQQRIVNEAQKAKDAADQAKARADKSYQDANKAAQDAKSASEAAHQAAIEAGAKSDSTMAELDSKMDAAEQERAEQEAARQDAEEQAGKESTETAGGATVEENGHTSFANTFQDPDDPIPAQVLEALDSFAKENPNAAKAIEAALKANPADKNAVQNVMAAVENFGNGNYGAGIIDLAQATGWSVLSVMNMLGGALKNAVMTGLNVLWEFLKSGKPGSQMNLTPQEMDTLYNNYDDIEAIMNKSSDKKTFDYMKDIGATNVSNYNKGIGEDVNEVVSDATKKIIKYSPYVISAVKKWSK